MEDKLLNDFSGTSREEWKSKIVNDLKGKAYETLCWQAAGLSGEPIYTEEDLPETLTSLANIPEQPEVFGARNWVNYQSITVGDEKEANQKGLQALNNGADGLIFALNEQPDWNELLKDIELAYCHIGIEDHSADANILEGFLENISGQQPYGFYAGYLKWQPEVENLDHFRSLNFLCPEKVHQGLPVRELACLLSMAASTFDKLTEGGVAINSLFSHSQFQLSTGSHYFSEIAKYRALRALIARFASAYQVELSTSAIQVLAKTQDWSASLDDPHSHLIAATTQAMSAILGGTDGLCIQPFYPVFEKNTRLAERAARNISSILKEESYLNKVTDPAAGTYLIESLTQTIADQAWQLFLLMEKQGGFESLHASQMETLHQQING